MRDDAPRSSGYRYRGFESGLRRNDGRKKPAYNGFYSPLAVERARNHDVLWGRIRTRAERQQVTIEVRRKGKKKFSKLRTVTTNDRGVFGLTATHRKGQSFRVRWSSSTGRTRVGPAIKAY
jgi:hypothetical protein